MTREKYLADIDSVLIKTIAQQSDSLADKNAIRFAEELVEQGHIRKVAFDVYKVDNDPYQDLWILDNVNGVPHLVRARDPQYEITSSGSWGAVSDYEKKNITLTYKDKPIARFSSDSYGFSSEDIIVFKEALLERIDSDEHFIKEVFAEQPREKITSLKTTFPELSKYI